MGSIINRADFFASLQSHARIEHDIARVREIAEQEITRIEAEWKAKLERRRKRIDGLLTKISADLPCDVEFGEGV